MSESDSEPEKKYVLQIYSLVRFIHKGRKRKIESIDLVPSKWLDFDKARARCTTKFMEEPYSDEDLQMINELVIHNVDAPEDWPTYPVHLIGRASTYEEGERKLEELRTKEHVLTLESEDSTSEAQRHFTIAVKRKKLESAAQKLKSKLYSTKNKVPLQIFDNATHIEKDHIKKIENQSGSSKETAPIQVTCSVPEIINSSTPTTFYKNIYGITPIVNINPVAGIFYPCPSSPILPSTLQEASTVEDYFSMNNTEVKDVPIIHLDQIQCKSQFETTVIEGMQQIHASIIKMKEKQNDMATEISTLKVKLDETCNFLSDKKFVGDIVDFEQKYQLKVPMDSHAEFQVFEQKLKNETFFKKDVYIALKSKMSKDYTISKLMVQMVKCFLTRELAIQFTAIRSSKLNKNKYKFKLTQLCNLIEGIISNERKEKLFNTTEEELNNSLSDVFSNIYKWKS